MDYAKLLKANATLSSAKVTNGNIDLDALQLVDDEDAFIKAIQKADKRIDGAASVEDVEKQLNSAIEVVDEYMAKLTAVDLPAELKANLVKEIIDYAASLKITTKPATANDRTYSSTIVNKYNAIVDEAIAAAKAATTYKDYYEVINKYLGSDYDDNIVQKENKKTVCVVQSAKVVAATKVYPTNNTAGFVAITNGNSVQILETTNGELNNLQNMDIDTEAQVAAAQKVLNALGDYNYKDIAYTASNQDWKKAESFRLQLAKFVVSGNINDLTTSKLNSVIAAVDSTMAPSLVNAQVDKALDVYADYTRLEQYKDCLLYTSRCV